MKTLIVPNHYEKKKLITYLQDTFPNLKTSVIFKALRNKDIRVNNIKVRENILLQAQDMVTLYIEDRFLEPSFTPVIIYEDAHILLVDKPAGLEVVGNSRCLTTLLQDYFSNPNLAPCHRLDVHTSGLVLFAKHAEALSILLHKFKQHEIEKHYRAKVYGIPSVSGATLEAFLFKDRKQSRVYISDVFKKGYVKIKTSYQVCQIDTQAQTCILDVTLHTGKTHQIRAHLAHIGLPIIGDEKYGNFEINRREHCHVQQLQSYRLCFHFSSDSGILSYLDRKEFCIDSVF